MEFIFGKIADMVLLQFSSTTDISLTKHLSA